MEKREIIVKGDLRIPCVITEPDDGQIRRIVLGVHGLGGSSEDAIQVSIAEEMGIFCSATVRFDFPGHGASPRDCGFTLENCMESLMAAAVYARQQYPLVEDLCVFATGFGAYVTLLCLPRLQDLPGRVKLVVQTPSVCMHETLLAMLNITEQTLREQGKITIPTSRPLEITYGLYESLQKNSALTVCSQPILILQGQEDAYIRSEDIRYFHELNALSRLVTIPGATHRFLEDGAWDMVLDLTRDWFEFEQVLLSDWN